MSAKRRRSSWKPAAVDAVGAIRAAARPCRAGVVVHQPEIDRGDRVERDGLAVEGERPADRAAARRIGDLEREIRRRRRAADRTRDSRAPIASSASMTSAVGLSSAMPATRIIAAASVANARASAARQRPAADPEIGRAMRPTKRQPCADVRCNSDLRAAARRAAWRGGGSRPGSRAAGAARTAGRRRRCTACVGIGWYPAVVVRRARAPGAGGQAGHGGEMHERSAVGNAPPPRANGQRRIDHAAGDAVEPREQERARAPRLRHSAGPPDRALAKCCVGR